ncbi:hypothetical protein SH668x_001568 [Planctomicrobium sp. SH668]|uniref:hypothetical protein n=1 Tax=Planctomicrobium sp. SH668 TaxID=3448126 RepID=UPI003F5B030A
MRQSPKLHLLTVIPFIVAVLGLSTTLIVFIWSGVFGPVHVFFKIVGTWIGICAISVTVGMIANSMRIVSQSPASSQPAMPHGGQSQSPRYHCEHCSAKLDKESTVSPLGDIQCTYCGKWFNIHRPHAHS